MASIEPCAGSTCEGALYTLTRDGYEALWKSEGGSMSRPGYEEVVVSASVGGETVEAITLRAAPWMRRGPRCCWSCRIVFSNSCWSIFVSGIRLRSHTYPQDV